MVNGSISYGIEIRLPAHHYEIFVGDTEVTSHNYKNVYTNSSGRNSGWVKYEPNTNTLKVNGKVDLSGFTSPTIRNEGAENLTVEFILGGYEEVEDEYGDSSWEEDISVLVGGLDLRTNTVIKGGETEKPVRITPVSGNSVTVRSGAALTIDHAAISASGAVGGSGTGESLCFMTSALSCKSSDGVRSAVNGFSGGITFDDCGVKTPAGGKVSGTAILAANGDTFLDGLTILPDEHYPLWFYDNGIITNLTERNVNQLIEAIAERSDDAIERFLSGEEIASYDGMTLTLNNVNIGDLCLSFHGGSNTIRVVGDCRFGSQIFVYEDAELTVTGDGSLTASSNSAYIKALYNRKITVKDTTLNSTLKGDNDPGCQPELTIDSANIHAASGVGVFPGGITLMNASVTSPEKYILDTGIYTNDGFTLAQKVVITAEKKSLTNENVTLSQNAFAYTGRAIKIGNYISVKDGDKKLKYGTDFTLSYANNVECGVDTAAVTVTGIGKYKGTVTKNYTIVPVQQAAPKLSTVGGKLHIAWTKDANAQGYQVQYCRSKDFTGDTLKTLAYATKTACDAAEPAAGELWYVRVRVYVKNSSGTKYGTWSALSSLKVGRLSTVTLSQTEFDYTGKEVKVGSFITVKSGNQKLKYGTEFTMTYKNNVSKGTATVTVNGIGEYAGSSISKTYKIK